MRNLGLNSAYVTVHSPDANLEKAAGIGGSTGTAVQVQDPPAQAAAPAAPTTALTAVDTANLDKLTGELRELVEKLKHHPLMNDQTAKGLLTAATDANSGMANTIAQGLVLRVQAAEQKAAEQQDRLTKLEKFGADYKPGAEFQDMVGAEQMCRLAKRFKECKTREEVQRVVLESSPELMRAFGDRTKLEGEEVVFHHFTRGEVIWTGSIAAILMAAVGAFSYSAGKSAGAGGGRL